MKKRSLKALALTLPVLGSTIASPAVFAENYGISYTADGVELTSVVKQEPALVESLTEIIPRVTKTTFIGDDWETAYYSTKSGGEDVCLKTKYILVGNGEHTFPGEGLGFISAPEGTGYSLVVNFNKITASDFENDEEVIVSVIENTSSVHVGETIYSDSNCTNELKSQIALGDHRVFLEMNAKLFKNSKNSHRQVASDGVYFGINDIDAAQSYKILNDESKFVANQMITASKENLKDGYVEVSAENPTALENKFVSDGNYIYSQYALGNTQKHIQNTKADALMLSPVAKETLESGMDFTFGFVKSAYSGIQFYAHQLNVVYESDENGKISGITSEKVISGDTVSGSETEPNKGYELSYWVADKDVTLEDGTIIKKGEPISDEKIKEVVVSSDITFTAIHEKGVKVPDTGSYLIEVSQGAATVQLSAAVLSVAAIMAFCIARFKHKKVDFKK